MLSSVNHFIMNDMELSEPTPRIKKGRPLSFDREVALHQAMLLFWRHGYEATSLSDLTAAMGITAPSIYTAFGDKKRLFLEAVGRYLSGPVTSDSIIEGAATAEEAAWGLLRAAATGFTGADSPPGCLLASSAISCSAAAADVQGDVLAERGAGQYHGLAARSGAAPCSASGGGGRRRVYDPCRCSDVEALW